MKQISEQFTMQLAFDAGKVTKVNKFGVTPFIREGEPVAKAIKRMMAARKREWSTVSRVFPRFTPGVTTTAEYVQRYRLANTGQPFHCQMLPLTFRTGGAAPYVLRSEVEEETLDSIEDLI